MEGAVMMNCQKIIGGGGVLPGIRKEAGAVSLSPVISERGGLRWTEEVTPHG